MTTRKLPLNKIICGDSACLLKQIPDSSIDLVITSPPYYQQRSYGGGATGGEWSIKNYIDAVMEVFVECVRATKDTGSIVFNMGDKYVGGQLKLIPWRFALEAKSRTKLDLINEITWVKSNPTPRQFKRRFVPSTEPFFHFVKSRNYVYNLKAFEEGRAVTRLAAGTKGRLGGQYKELIKKSDLSADEKKRALDELRSVVSEVQEGKIAGFRMKIRGIHSPAFGGQDGGRRSQIENNGFTIIRMSGSTLNRDAIECHVENLKWNDHPAIYPEALISLLVTLLTDKSGVVLDPYMGSGTTAIAAKKAGRSYVGIDINPKYCDAAQKRVDEVL